MRQAKWLEQWPIDGEDGAIGHCEGETHLLFESERVDFLRGFR